MVYFRNLRQADPDTLLCSGSIEVEFYRNGPESARLAQELLAQMGGTIAKYEDDLGNVYEVQIILTAVRQ